MAFLAEPVKVSLLTMKGCGVKQRSHDEVKRLFNETFRKSEVSISKSIACKTSQRYIESGLKTNRPKSGRVVHSFVEDARLSI